MEGKEGSPIILRVTENITGAQCQKSTVTSSKRKQASMFSRITDWGRHVVPEVKSEFGRKEMTSVFT